MELWEKIVQAYPEIDPISDFTKIGIWLQDDNDGEGAYIAKWEYAHPLPDGMKVGKE